MITIGTKQEKLLIRARPVPYDPVEPAITRHRDDNAGVVVDRTKGARDVTVLFNQAAAKQEITSGAGAGHEFADITTGRVLFIASSATRAHGIRSTIANNIRWREATPGLSWEDAPAVAWVNVDTSDDL